MGETSFLPKPVEVKRGFASRAISVAACGCVSLDYGFHRFVVQTCLTYVVHRLSISGRLFQAIDERAHKSINKLVARTFANACFKLSNPIFKLIFRSQGRALALGGLKALLLHGDYLSPEMRQLNLKLIGGRRDLRFIERFHRRLVGADALGDARE